MHSSPWLERLCVYSLDLTKTETPCESGKCVFPPTVGPSCVHSAVQAVLPQTLLIEFGFD